MSFSMIFALAVFLAALLMIASKRFHKAVVAIAGGAVCMLAGVVDSDFAINFINWKAIFLLVGMMILISIVRRTGVFQFVAIRIAKICKGNPVGILVATSIVMAVCSAFFGPVLTVVAFTPVTILIAIELGISPLPFLIAQTLCSNIGGMLTLVGDPSSVLIGTEAGLSFAAFFINNGAIALLMLAVSIVLLAFVFRKQMSVSNERRARIMDFDEARSIQDLPLLVKSIVVICLVVLGFVLGPVSGIEPAVIALSGAILLLVLSMGKNIDDTIREVEWNTILYLVGLFIMVMSLQSQGITQGLALWLTELSHRDLMSIAMIVLWSSAIAAAFIDTLPFVIFAVPLIQSFAAFFGANEVLPLWWALSIGAILGGNVTLFGAPANLTVAGISTKNGYPLRFATFGRYSAPISFISLGIASVYIVIRYFAFKA